MSDNNKRLPAGLRMRAVNARGDQELPVMFGEGYQDTEADRQALSALGRGARGRLVVSGRYDRDAFQAESVEFLPATNDSAVDEIWCPLVVEALKDHLRIGDPEEPLLNDGKRVYTAQRVLEMLMQRDPRVLRFIEDIHGAALRTVRIRKRKPKKGGHR
jgi:hypothetical protein